MLLRVGRLLQMTLLPVLAVSFVPGCGSSEEKGAPNAEKSTLVVEGSPAPADGVAQAIVTITVLDSDGKAVADRAVRLNVSGAGNLVSQPALTNAAGITIGAVASTVAETKTITAIVDPGEEEEVQLDATGSATFEPVIDQHLVFSVQPSSVEKGAAITPAVTVEIQNSAGTVLTDATQEITIALASNPNGATLGGTKTVAAIAGVATFSDLSVDAFGAGYSLRASGTGFTAVTSALFNVTDTVAPGPVTNLAVSGTTYDTITLGWTAPGDDGAVGTADAYELRYSLAEITTANFDDADEIAGISDPAAAGTAESYVVDDLLAATTYYFGLKVTDAAGNASYAFVSGATESCPNHQTGLSCENCETGYHHPTGSSTCVDACTDPNPCGAKAADCTDDTLNTYTLSGCTPNTTTAPYYTCNYTSEPTDCTTVGDGGLCRDGACVDNPCTPQNPCTGKDAECAGATSLTTFDAPGTCTPSAGNAPTAECEYGSGTTGACDASTPFCRQQEGADECVNVCDENPCVSSTPGSCSADNTTLLEQVQSCTPTGPNPTDKTCGSDTPSQTVCTDTANVCFNAACVTAAAPVLGDLLITEVMQNTTGFQWFEVLNLSGKLLDLNGLVINETGGTTTATVNGHYLVPADSYFVFGKGAAAWVDYDYSAATLALAASDTLSLNVNTTTVASLTYDFSSLTAGHAAQLTAAVQEQSASQHMYYWCDATTALGDDFGTPAAANVDCFQVQLPIDACATAAATATTIVPGLPITVTSTVTEPYITTLNQNGNDGYPELEGEIGYGTGTDATAFTWTAAGFDSTYAPGAATDADQMVGTLSLPTAGTFKYAFRYRLHDIVADTYSAWAYCNSTAKSANEQDDATWREVTVTPAIQVVLGVADGSAAPLPLPVNNVLVTYVRPGSTGDSEGFFVQSDPTGPALFVRTSFTALGVTPTVGNVVSFTVTTVATQTGVKTATAITNFNPGTPGTLFEAQNISEAGPDAAAILANFSSERISVVGTIASAAASSGTGFVAYQVTTTGITSPSTGFVFRFPSVIASSLALDTGCVVTLQNVPLWRYNANAQPTAYQISEVTSVTNCPAPKLLRAEAMGPRKVVAYFDHPIAASSIISDGSQFAFDPALTLASSQAAQVHGASSILVSLDADMGAGPYTLTVATTLTDTAQTPLSASANTATVAGYDAAKPQVVISQFYAGGGNGGAVYTYDFVELHNRGTQAVSLSGWSLQYSSASGSTWGNTNNNFALSGTILPGQYFLVQLAAGTNTIADLPVTADLTGLIGLGATDGKIALLNTTTTLSGACPLPNANIVDFVGYGSANCSEGKAMMVLSNWLGGMRKDATGAATGCIDSNVNWSDMLVVSPMPRNSGSSNPCVW